MSHRKIALAMKRFAAVLPRRPEFGLQDDAPATAQWQRGMRVTTSPPGGIVAAGVAPSPVPGAVVRATPIDLRIDVAEG